MALPFVYLLHGYICEDSHVGPACASYDPSNRSHSTISSKFYKPQGHLSNGTYCWIEIRGFDILIPLKLCFPNFMTENLLMSLGTFDYGSLFFFYTFCHGSHDIIFFVFFCFYVRAFQLLTFGSQEVEKLKKKKNADQSKKKLVPLVQFQS